MKLFDFKNSNMYIHIYNIIFSDIKLSYYHFVLYTVSIISVLSDDDVFFRLKARNSQKTPESLALCLITWFTPATSFVETVIPASFSHHHDGVNIKMDI